MKSCLSGIAVTVLLLCFTGSVSAEMLGESSLNEIKQVQGECGKVVKGWTIQYKSSVRIKNKTRIKLSSKMLRQAVINHAVAGDLSKKVQGGGRIDGKHLRGCRAISSELSGGIVHFTAGRLDMVRKILVKVEELAGGQPRPVQLALVLSKFKELQKQILFVRNEKERTEEDWRQLQTKGSYFKPGSSKGKPGSSKGKPGSSKGKPGSSKGKPGSSKGKPGSSKGKPGSSKGKPGSSGGGSTNPCVADPASCLSQIGITDPSTIPYFQNVDWTTVDWTIVTYLSTIPNINSVDWTGFDWTIITSTTTTIDWSQINWTTVVINTDGTIDWGGIGCTGYGIQCYSCDNGTLVVDTTLPCDDNDPSTINDTCSSSGVCTGLPFISPIIPPNSF